RPPAAMTGAASATGVGGLGLLAKRAQEVAPMWQAGGLVGEEERAAVLGGAVRPGAVGHESAEPDHRAGGRLDGEHVGVGEVVLAHLQAVEAFDVGALRELAGGMAAGGDLQTAVRAGR